MSRWAVLIILFLLCLIPTNYLLKFLHRFKLSSTARTLFGAAFLFALAGLIASLADGPLASLFETLEKGPKIFKFF
ncbi:hypothetical protein SY88_15120 [Clostridiales bacterium PH28_bin88]|nr:hypothetical protein SY88_15120 [Clostridiales bacterium PH28_bin88]